MSAGNRMPSTQMPLAIPLSPWSRPMATGVAMVASTRRPEGQDRSDQPVRVMARRLSRNMPGSSLPSHCEIAVRTITGRATSSAGTPQKAQAARQTPAAASPATNHQLDGSLIAANGTKTKARTPKPSRATSGARSPGRSVVWTPAVMPGRLLVSCAIRIRPGAGVVAQPWGVAGTADRRRCLFPWRRIAPRFRLHERRHRRRRSHSWRHPVTRVQPSRSLALLAAGALAITVMSAQAGSAADPPTPPDGWSATGVEQDGPAIHAPLSASGAMALSDEDLLSRTDAEVVPVMVKLDLDGAASYAGGKEGLPATSPEVTGKSLSANPAAVNRYLAHAEEVTAEAA